MTFIKKLVNSKTAVKTTDVSMFSDKTIADALDGQQYQAGLNALCTSRMVK